MTERSADVAAGVTAPDGSDAALAPVAFVAETVKVYGVPFARPFTVQDVVGAAATQTAPPGDATTRYDTIAEVPGSGAAQLTVAAPLPATAVGAAGVAGGSPGVASFEAFDGSLVPSAFVAVTVNV